MTMPTDLVLVRHGESEGNVAARAARAGDFSAFTDDFVTTPGHQWHLTETGVAQAQAIGAWLHGQIADARSDSGFGEAPLDGFHRAYVSPYLRACQTAGHLGLGLRWFKNRAIRERDWGDIGTTPQAEFRAKYPDNARQRDIDPLYWVPPGGESIAHVAENRVRNFLDTLHREASGPVLAVTHGEYMQAIRLVLERLDDSDFARLSSGGPGGERLRNGEVLHYTRRDPASGQMRDSLRWMRRAAPVLNDERWSVQAGEWLPIVFGSYSDQDLRDGSGPTHRR